MADDLQWTPKLWREAIAALPSLGKLLALHEGRSATHVEVLGAVREHCHDKPDVAAGPRPDLSACAEGGWNHLKQVEMRNLVCHDLEDLHEQFHLAINGRNLPDRE